MFSFLRYKKAIATVLIIPILFFGTPRQTEAFVGEAVAAGIVIYCVVSQKCSEGNSRFSGGSRTSSERSCSYREGRTCYSRGNYCGQKSRGRYTCSGSCNAGAPPPDSNCNNYPLPDDVITFDKDIVRDGDTVTVQWDLGTGAGSNYPPNCTLTGPGINETLGSPSSNTATTPPSQPTREELRAAFRSGDQNLISALLRQQQAYVEYVRNNRRNTTNVSSRGSRTITVTGPHTYTLTCGTQSVSKTLRILPTLYES